MEITTRGCHYTSWTYIRWYYQWSEMGKTYSWMSNTLTLSHQGKMLKKIMHWNSSDIQQNLWLLCDNFNCQKYVVMILKTGGLLHKIFWRSRQDSNLRGETPMDFKSIALTTRPRLQLNKYDENVDSKKIYILLKMHQRKFQPFFFIPLPHQKLRLSFVVSDMTKEHDDDVCKTLNIRKNFLLLLRSAAPLLLAHVISFLSWWRLIKYE